MKFFYYKNNQFFVENLSIAEIANQVDTPFYCYSRASLIENYQNFAKSFADIDHKICYAIKANSNLHLVKILAGLGSGIDAVSAGEIWRSLKAGINPKKIVFAGVGKTAEEMNFALENGVEEFSIESESELYLLAGIAKNLGKKAKIAIRVNPNVSAGGHHKISTGKKGDKFGIDIIDAPKLYHKARELAGLEIFGIATHIGSQINDLAPFEAAFLKIRNLFLELKQQGFKISNLDFGGGIGIVYDDEAPIIISEYANMIKKIIGDLGVSLTIAPGRAIIGSAGIMVGKIIHIKKTSHKNFVIIDAAMNDLMRPGLYDSYHQIIPINKKIGESDKFDIVGPVCETTDILAKNRDLINPQNGDLLTFGACGAYGSAMSNQYNSRPLIPEILVDGDKFKIIRKRPSYEEMVGLENFSLHDIF